jgi:Glycosyltransferase (GlcNAc)
MYQRRTIHHDMIQIIYNETSSSSSSSSSHSHECPYMNQIRMIRVHDIKSYGPIYTRSLIRHVLGNEEYCLQIDSHSIFTSSWDTMIIHEWKQIQNEFGILTNVPHSIDEQYLYHHETGTNQSYVPRQCAIQFHPEYHYPVCFIIKFACIDIYIYIFFFVFFS